MPVECLMNKCQINMFMKKLFKTLTVVSTIGLFNLAVQNNVSTNVVIATENIDQSGALVVRGRASGLPHTTAMERVLD